MDSWWWSSWWVIIAASNCHDFMMKGMVWTLKVMVWWHFVHDIEHKVKSSCSLILVMFGLVLLQLTLCIPSTKCDSGVFVLVVMFGLVLLQLTLCIPSTKCDSGVFVLIVVMFGLASLQLTQWISSTKCVWWSNFSSWWYWFSLMTLSKIQQFLEFLKRKTGIFLTASSGFNVQEDHLWHLPPTWQKPCIISESWNFLGCPYGAGEFAMSWVLLAMNGPSHQVFTICATLGCFCSGWTWWSSCAVTNVKKKWRKKSKNWMVS